MAISSDDVHGKIPGVGGAPHIDAVVPASSLPGGEVKIIGSGLRPKELQRPRVRFGEIDGGIVISSDHFLVARVPETAHSGPLVVSPNGHDSNPVDFHVAVPIAENLHPVANPALDLEGNIYATFSGQRGQRVPVSIYKIDANYNVRPFLSDLMNATALAFDRDDQLYVSSRHDGTVYKVSKNGTMSSYAEGMGIATGIAFDRHENLYVGDRSGTIFKVARDKQIYVFATLEPSVAAYHLAFGPGDILYVTGPTTSSFDVVHAVDPHGAISVYYRGLGRPQGMAFDVDGNLYVAASHSGRRGIIRITPQKDVSLVVAGRALVGLAHAPGRSAVLTTGNAVYHLPWGIQGYSVFD